MKSTSESATRAVESPLPEGVLRDALGRLSEALGEEKVLSTRSDLDAFRDPFSHADWDEYTAAAVVMPTTVEEVQAVVRIANETGVPLWTHSQGRNNGYGGPAPRVKGSVIVSLRNMNRVLEINEELGYAVVEPGVRWFDLYEAIEAHGASLMVSIADIGWGSVIGNTLEHGATYLPYGLDFQAQCGMEVVLADGDLMRTGMGAMDGNRAWHCYRRGMGPTLDQLFMQSNFGIVTKMGVWLMPKPEVYMPLWLRVWNDDDLGPLIDTLRRLMLDGTIRMVPQIMSTILLGSVFSRRERWYTGEGAIPDEIIATMAREMQAGRWLMRFALFGDEAVVDHRFAKVKTAFEEAIPGAELWGEKHSPDDIAALENPSEQVGGGVPTLALNAQTAWYGGEEGGHVGFSPIGPLTGADAIAIRDLMRRLVHEAGLDYIAALIPLTARSFVHVTLIIFDTKNEQQARAAYDVARRLVIEAGKLGYGEYRAHLDFMDLAAEQYSFNDHAYMRFNERIKDALDPNGILSPGKQGIWPSRLRAERAPTA
jgi:4-cresol dehydrogenase (hydroxylating)